MKKLLLIFSVLFLADPAAAQSLTNYNTKIATIYHGTPKTVMDIAEGQGVCITEFDRNGRIVSEKRDKYDYTFNYRWTDTQLILTMCNDEGQVLNSLAMNYVEEPGRLLIDSGKMGSIEFFFNDNGTVQKVLFNKNGQQSGFSTRYESDNPYLCTSFELFTNGKVTGTATNEYLEEDEHGNPIECIQSANGNSFAIHRKITYYE